MLDRSEVGGHPRPRAGARLAGVDWLRGLVMVLMVLDHVREFFGRAGVNPTDVSQTTVPLFLTRWVTHFCAPVFVLLAGVGAALWRDRGERSAGELSRFLALRGAWLVVLEVVLVHWGMTFDWTFQFVPLTVVWVIGMGFLTLAPLVLLLPRWSIGGLGVLLIVGHNAFDGVTIGSEGTAIRGLWTLLHQQGIAFTVAGRPIFVAYPLVPWIGVLWAGYALGDLYRWPDLARRRTLIGLGLAITLGFVCLRAWNAYGDPKPWAPQDDPVRTALGFLNGQKYPPSLLYLLMTLGPALVVLGRVDAVTDGGAVSRWLIMLGRVPLFFYLLQWYLIHLLAIAVAATVGQPWRWLLTNGPFQGPKEYGYDLWVTYVVWGFTMLLLTGPSAWFARYKKARPGGWRQYF